MIAERSAWRAMDDREFLAWQIGRALKAARDARIFLAEQEKRLEKILG